MREMEAKRRRLKQSIRIGPLSFTRDICGKAGLSAAARYVKKL
jgi:hypothetical protein